MNLAADSNRTSVSALRCEYLTNPIGIDINRPRLSWEIAAAKRGTRQKACQIVVNTETDDLLWDSGRVDSDQSVHVIYDGPVLQSRQRYTWQVRIWDETDTVTDWSSAAFWEMALLSHSDWQAKWIVPEQAPTTMEPEMKFFQKLAPVPPDFVRDYSKLNPCQYLRKSFRIDGIIKQARVYATAHGVYRLSVNDSRIGDQELAPGATAYDKYLEYQTYDLTGQLKQGENVIGAVLADGWYTGRIGLPGDSCQYGDQLALLLQLEIEYLDGRRQVIVSDADFESSTGPLRYSDLFIGEKYDARLESSVREWRRVNTADYGYANLVAQIGDPVRAIQEIKPVAVITTPKGETVVDLGQVIAGRFRMRVQGTAGSEISLEFSEVLDQDGNFLINIIGRNKDQKDFYILKGGDIETYEPWFTFHGFRYIKVVGYPGEIGPDDFAGVVLASDLRPSGTFECSDPRLNQLQQNIVWSQKANMLSIPTDCPQRERAGFTGDAQIYSPTACFNMDMDAFFTRWLRNVVLEQLDDGQVPNNVPYWKSYGETFFPIQQSHTSAAWGDACIIVPWVLYNAYGDVRVLEETYRTMVRWVAYIEQQAASGIPETFEGEMTPERIERQKFLWNTGFHFGDWLIPSMTAGYANPFESAKATKELVACCFYAYSTELLAQIAAVLGKREDAERYQALSQKIRQAFADEYLRPDGSFKNHFQGIYVLALKMKMVPDDARGKVVSQLASLIEANGYRLDTGFVTVSYLLDALSDNGRKDLAYKILFQTECPSWLYQVEKGATTMWETWDAIRPDGHVNLSSFNHYAFGCVGDWLYKFIAGLNHDQPGYRHITIKPDMDGGLLGAKASYQSVYGQISSSWQRGQNGRTTLQAEIPGNTTATVRLPDALLAEVIESGVRIDQAKGVTQATQTADGLELEIGSGKYSFNW